MFNDNIIKCSNWNLDLLYPILIYYVDQSKHKNTFSFVLDDRVGNWLIGFLSESLVAKKQVIPSFTHFWWATWANHSQALIFGERPEQFIYSRSIVMSDLSDSLTLLCKNDSQILQI